MTVRPGAEPYVHDGDGLAFLLCHGFTGNPSSLRDWAQAIASAGHTVHLPRLPGHGTSWREMGRTRWEDWYGEVDSAFQKLHADADVVVAGGLSMGGALALALAQEHPDAVDGLVLVNPAIRLDDPRLKALPVVRWVVPWLPPVGNDIRKAGVTEDAYDRIPPHALSSMLAGFRRVTAALPAVRQPVLLFRSPQDHVVPATSSAAIRAGISAADVTEVLCENSFHVATLDHDAPMIFERSIEFMERVAADRGASR